MHIHTCRLIRTQGSLPSSLLYVAYFLPTSINAAWLSVASGLGVLIVPVSYGGSSAYVEAEAVVLAVVVTAAGIELDMEVSMKPYTWSLLQCTSKAALANSSPANMF